MVFDLLGRCQWANDNVAAVHVTWAHVLRQERACKMQPLPAIRPYLHCGPFDFPHPSHVRNKFSEVFVPDEP